MGNKTTEESKSKPNRIWRRIQLMFSNNLPSWFCRVAMWSDYILNIYIYTDRPVLFSALLLFSVGEVNADTHNWSKAENKGMQKPTPPGHPITTTPICQGSGSLQRRKQKECKSHWWRQKLGKAVFWPWQSYCTHELCGDYRRPGLDQDSQSSSVNGKDMHKVPSLTEAVLAVCAGGERVILWRFVVTGRLSTCQWTASRSHTSTHH